MEVLDMYQEAQDGSGGSRRVQDGSWRVQEGSRRDPGGSESVWEGSGGSMILQEDLGVSQRVIEGQENLGGSGRVQGSPGGPGSQEGHITVTLFIPF